MSVSYTKKTWYDGSEGGTPITAAELNRVETGIDDVVTQSNANKTNIDNHTASKVNSSDGAHGLRYHNSELDYYDETNEEWVEIETGGDDFANKNLSNISDTTSTDVKNRVKNIGVSITNITPHHNSPSYVDGKYIWFEEDNNTVYTCISNDGLTLTSRKANNLVVGEYGWDIFIKNSVSGVYIIVGELSSSPGDSTIHCSTDLINWTRVILPGSLGTNGIYFIDRSSTNGYWAYEFKGITYLFIHLYEDIEGSPYQSGVKLISTTDCITWTNHTDTNIEDYGQQPIYIDNDIIIGGNGSGSGAKSTDGITWTTFAPEQWMSVFLVNKVGNNYYIIAKHGMNHQIKIYSTTDFTNFTVALDLHSEMSAKYTDYTTYFEDGASALYNMEVKKYNDSYIIFSDTRAKVENQINAAYLVIPTDLNTDNIEWVEIPKTISDSDYSYYWNLFSSIYDMNNDIRVFNNYDYQSYGLFESSAFTFEVSNALDILGVGSSEGGASSAEDVSYDNTNSGLTADNVQDAIDEVLTKETTVTTDSNGYVITDPKNTHVTIPPASLSGTASMAVKSGTQGTVYTITDYAGQSTADVYTKSAVDELVSGLHGIPSGGNTNQVLAKNSSSDYDLKWVNQTGGGSGFKIIVTASDYPNKSVTVTESDSGDTVTETTNANGVATFIVSAGTWTATVDDSGTTVTLGSVTVGTTSIEYLGNNVKFAFHYSEKDSDPDSVDYPSGYDNSDWSSDTAYMDYTNDTFHYGNWNPNGTNAKKLSWLFPKPCMLKNDGTVDYYLDPNDYTKKADGTASDIANTSYGGNAMMEWGQEGKKIWWKIIPDVGDNGFTFCVANYQADEDYDCWNHYDCDNEIKDHFYTPIYFGSLVSSKLRSLSGQANSVSTTRQNEIDYATANNTDSKVHWYTEVYSDWLLQGMLTTLITKSLDSQTKIGKGVTSASAAINTGTMNTKGLFWGSTNGTDGVKCWGMENTWGNLYRAIGGLIASTQTIKFKLTPNDHDGTTATSYNTDGTGYTTANTISGSSGYISHMYATKKSLTPATLSGSESTYYCDRCYTTTTANTYYALVGGHWYSTAVAGAFCVNLNNGASGADATRGAALSYK